MLDHPYAPETWIPYLFLFFDLLKGIAWPFVLLVVFVVFRDQLGEMVARIRNLSAIGVEVGLEPKQGKVSSPTESALALNSAGEGQTAAFLKVEQRIRDDLLLISADKREDLLIFHLAGEKLLRHFTAVYSQIFGSQIRLLRSIERLEGQVTVEWFEDFFKDVKGEHSEFRDWDAHQYLRYLETSLVVEKVDERIVLTDIGRDFLKWIVVSGVSEAKAL